MVDLLSRLLELIAKGLRASTSWMWETFIVPILMALFKLSRSLLKIAVIYAPSLLCLAWWWLAKEKVIIWAINKWQLPRWIDKISGDTLLILAGLWAALITLGGILYLVWLSWKWATRSGVN
jgi:hypothetical protein